MVSLGHAAEALTTLRCHSNLEELGLRHSPGSLAVVVSRCATTSYGEQVQYAVSQCVTGRPALRHPASTGPRPLVEYSTWYYSWHIPRPHPKWRRNHEEATAPDRSSERESRANR
jgi:hypothetical protein